VPVPPIVMSYLRVFAAAVLTLYMAGETSPSKLWAAGVAAVLPPLIRWLNPNDSAYGRGSW
jgi:uncharacterized MAPEG superfamily protein